jgi:hypothetical protein
MEIKKKDHPMKLAKLLLSVSMLVTVIQKSGQMVAQAQPCIGGWSDEFYGGDFDAGVHTMIEFDDGTGPALYVGGRFTLAGGEDANRIAKWDGVNWAPLGSGTAADFFGDDGVRALAVFDDGGGPALFVGGGFSIAGGVAASNVAKWDGSSWFPLGSGAHIGVSSLAVFDDGSGAALFVGGQWPGDAGGVAVNHIARWDGTNWSAVGSGSNGTDGRIFALAVFDDGGGDALYVGGSFNNAGGSPAVNVAKWDGFNWAPVGSGLAGMVTSFVIFDDGGGEVKRFMP